MILTRNLKFAYFQLDTEKKEVLLRNKVTNQEVTFNKVYMFSALRFLVSASQKLTVHRTKSIQKELPLEDENDRIEEQ